MMVIDLDSHSRPRTVSKLSFLLAVVLTLMTHVRPTTAQTLKEIRIVGSSFTTQTFPIYFTRDAKFFEKEGLDVKIVLVQTSVGLAALARGDVDYNMNAPSAIEAALKGLPFVAIALTPGQPLWGLVVRKEITQIADLKGKRIATTSFGGLLHSITIEFLKHYGLNQQDVVLWPVGAPPLRIAALISGQVDASILTAPDDIVIAKKGFKILLDVGTIMKVPNGGLSTTAVQIRENRADVAKAFRAIARATKFFIDPRNKVEAITYLATKFKLEKSAAEELYPRLVATLPPTAMVDKDAVKSFIDGAVTRGITNKPLEPEQVVDFSFANEFGSSSY